MKRVAIILGSPFPQSHPNHLRGVHFDVGNYQRFLMSPIGGAWQSNEIYYEEHPTGTTVKAIHQLCNNADMAVVIFSGHGYMQWNETYICLNPRQNLNVCDLTTTAKRQITIVDCCRKNYSVEHWEGIGRIYSLSFDNTCPDIGRKLYDFQLERSPVGHYTMYSCSQDQYSQDGENGGLFSYNLLRGVKDWEKQSGDVFLSANSAFKIGSQRLYNQGAEQIPEYSYRGTELPQLPFTVSPTAYISQYERRLVSRKSYSHR